MSYPNLANGWTSTLSGAIDTDDTTVDVAATAGMPSRPFQAVILAEGANTDEIVTVTNLSSSTITITRATEANAAGSSSASSHASGAVISHVLTAADIRRAVLEPLSFPVTASSYDDEFETTDTSDPMSGWTTLGSPTAHDINSTALSHYYVKQTATASTSWVGIYKTPPSTPFTVTAKLSDSCIRAAWQGAALFVGEASPGKMMVVERRAMTSNKSGAIATELFTNPTTYSATYVSLDDERTASVWLRLVVTSSTNISAYWSTAGLAWNLLEASRDPGFTVGSVGLCAKTENGTYDQHAFFDWIRFT